MLAFCFLIYDSIENAEVWETFFSSANESKYTIVIHAKKDCKNLGFFEKYKLDNPIETKYADISITYAHKLTYEKALQNKEVYRVINLSGTCIPVKSFDYIYNELINIPYSIFNTAKNDKNKSSQWFSLIRADCEIVLNDNTFINDFITTRAPEELYFIRLLINNKCNLHLTNNICLDALTFTNWADMDYPQKYKNVVLRGVGRIQKKIYKGLKNYTNITDEELMLIINSKSLFARKFYNSCNLYNKSYYINKINATANL